MRQHSIAVLKCTTARFPFLLHIRNTGHIQAENLVVKLTAIGGTLHDRFACYPLFGPPAPQPKPYDPLRAFPNFDVGHLRQQVGRHEMEFAAGPDRSDIIEVYCADFRQGREWRFQGIAQVDPHAGSPFRVQVNVTASNLHGAIDRSFELEYTSKSVTSDELVGLESREYHIEIPMAQQFAEAVEAGNSEWFDFVHNEENDDLD